MKTYGQRRRSAAVFLIVATIVILIDMIFYIRFYQCLKDCNHDFLQTFRSATVYSIAFIFGTVVWLVLSIETLVKFRRLNIALGSNFGRVMGALIIVGEYIGYIAAIVLLFVLK